MNEILELNKNNIKFCTSFKDRLNGMTLKKEKENLIYCFPKCNSIHTFFMRKKIDVIMTDKDNNIIKIINNLKPNRIIFPQKNVYYIYEFDHNYIDTSNSFKKINLK